jgi:hypothetical protein
MIKAGASHRLMRIVRLARLSRRQTRPKSSLRRTIPIAAMQGAARTLATGQKAALLL